MDELGRAKKQQHLFSTFLFMKDEAPLVLKKTLLEEADTSASVLSELLKKGFLETYEYEVSRFDYGDTNIDAASELNEYQRKALEEIKDCLLYTSKPTSR